MRISILFLLACLPAVAPSAALPLPLPAPSPLQDNQHGPAINNLYWGIKFTAPAGWSVQQNGEGYALTRARAGEVMVVAPHAYLSLQELSVAAAQSALSQEGAQLRPLGEVRSFGESGVWLDLAGTLQGAAYRCRAIGLVNRQGPGVLVLLLQPESAGHGPDLTPADELAAAVAFSPPSTEELIGQWQAWLAGSQLLFVSSYNSGTSGGYSMESSLSLCQDQRFTFSSQSSVAMDAGGLSGSSSSRDSGTGRWLLQAPQGVPVLVLLFDDGRSRRHQLGYESDQLFVDGERYFRGSDPDCR